MTAAFKHWSTSFYNFSFITCIGHCVPHESLWNTSATTFQRKMFITKFHNMKIDTHATMRNIQPKLSKEVKETHYLFFTNNQCIIILNSRKYLGNIKSRNVLTVSNRRTSTSLFWPILWALAWACRSTWENQNENETHLETKIQSQL